MVLAGPPPSSRSRPPDRNTGCCARPTAVTDTVSDAARERSPPASGTPCEAMPAASSPASPRSGGRPKAASRQIGSAPMAARSDRLTAAARAPICRSDRRDESKCTPSTSMSQQTTSPPSSTAASSPMPTTRPSPVPATARMRSSSSSSGSMGGNVPAVLLRLRLYHPAGRHLSAPEQIRELSGPPRGRPFLLRNR